jgi:bifunctional non-homologous end joining protein LigD
MLATLSAAPPTGDGWVHEAKLDGFRVIAGLDDGDVSLWSRNGLDVADRFRRVALDLGRGLRTFTCVVDGEVCAVDDAGVPRFQLLQSGKGTLVYYVFDLLEVEGEVYVARTFDERRAELERLVDERARTIRLSRAFEDGEALLRQTAASGLEGIVSKRRNSRYAVGRRSSDWQKVKHRADGVFAIAGYLAGNGRRSRLGSLVLAARDGKGLSYVGLVGAGLSESVIDELLVELEKRRTDQPQIDVSRKDRRLRGGRVVWCKPTMKCRVEFAEWTNDGRLRSPVFKGVVTREKVSPVPELDLPGV